MNLVKLSGMEVVEYPYSRAELRQDYPNISFPNILTDDVLAPYGVAIVHPFPMPQGVEVYTFDEGLPELIGGRWQQTWVMREYTQEELDEMELSYPKFTALEMLDLFTESEQLDIVSATMVNPSVKLWYDRLIAASFVTYEDPRTGVGLQALVDAELLDSVRKAEIVAAMQPHKVVG